MTGRARPATLSRWMLAPFVWGAAEASLFFVVPDVVIGYIALRRGWRAGVIAAAMAALGAVIGGAVIYLWSAQSPRALAAVEAVPAVSLGMVGAARGDILLDGWLAAALRGPLTSTPYKVYAALAPEAGVSLPVMAAVTVPARLPRFLLAALGMAAVGALVRDRLSARTLTALYLCAWVVFYVAFWTSNPG